jgi:phosphatidylserine decarboxylase
MNSTRRSARKIPRFTADYNIDTSEFAQDSFASFNAFITRKLRPEARPIDPSPTHLIAVADSKLLATHLDDQASIAVKHATFSTASLLDDDELSLGYKGGTCLVFRLSVDDCHRFAYPDAGTLVSSKEIPGKLHSVQPIAQQTCRVFHQNKRRVSVLATASLGQVVQVEVGALLVGGLHDHQLPSFERGQEKGYFELGGSTVILLLKQGVVRINRAIEEQSRQGIETKVKLGQAVGEVECNA